MKDVTYEGKYGYATVDGQTFHKGRPESVPNELAESCAKLPGFRVGEDDGYGADVEAEPDPEPVEHMSDLDD
jgi:hypothetical protein